MHFLEIFGQKKCLLRSKKVFLGQKVHYYMVYIAYFTELNLQICHYAQKRRICRENCKYSNDENFHGHFCPWRKAAKFCHPGLYISMNGLNTINCKNYQSIVLKGRCLWMGQTRSLNLKLINIEQSEDVSSEALAIFQLQISGRKWGQNSRSSLHS